MNIRLHRRRARPQEGGYILISILFMLTLMVVGLAVVAPRMKTAIQRDNEEELVRRARQYTRAIQLYYRKFGRFPNSVEQLEDTNRIRFLRKKYVDPVTGKDEWKLLRYGQVRPKPRPAYLPAAGGPASPIAPGTGPTSGSGGKDGAGIGTPASDMSKPLSGSGSTIGGGPIVGIASTSEKTGLKEFDGRTKYNQWEFVYDPTLDPFARGQNNPPGGPRGDRPARPGSGPTPVPPSPSPR